MITYSDQIMHKFQNKECINSTFDSILIDYISYLGINKSYYIHPVMQILVIHYYIPLTLVDLLAEQVTYCSRGGRSHDCVGVT